MGARFTIKKTISTRGMAEQLEPMVANLMDAIATRMERLVPKRTFNLHDTITSGTSIQGSLVVGEVGVGGNGQAPYWDAVEYGTSQMAAQPYIRPALLQSKSSDLLGGAAPASGGSNLVTYTRKDGSTRQATAAQAKNWSGGRQ